MTTTPFECQTDECIFVDEVGLAYAVLGDFRLRSTFQPIFHKRGDILWPIAVEGSVAVHKDGRPVRPELALAGLGSEGPALVESIGRALTFRNHDNLGTEGLQLIIPCIGGEAALVDMAREIERSGVDPRLLVCDVATAGERSDDAWIALVEGLRSFGADVALTVGPSRKGPSIELVRPEWVRIDAAWFTDLCRWSATARLFRTMVGGFRQHGARVLVPAIEDEGGLAVGVKAGGTLFQGHFLAGYAPAGAIVDDAPLRISDRLGGSGNVVRLYG